ncbi:hypothetical protein ABIB38_002990 [Massilia sp. UYP11]
MMTKYCNIVSKVTGQRRALSSSPGLPQSRAGAAALTGGDRHH